MKRIRALKPVPVDTPFAKWLITQTENLTITLTELGRRAGLSTGTLRGLVYIPGREPSVDTCLRLAHALGLPVKEVLTIANSGTPLLSELDEIDPYYVEFMHIYNQLPIPNRRILLDMARTLLQ